MGKSALVVPVLLAGCAAPYPPERVERDNLILAAVKPCIERYSHIIYNPNMVSVDQDGRLRYWQWGDRALAQSYEVEQCITEARKDQKIGPWARARLAQPVPTTLSITVSGREVLVPVRVNGVPGTMAVRSGSQLTSVTAAYAKRAGVQIVAESPTTHVRTGEKTFVIPYGRAKALELGDIVAQPLDIGVYEALPDHAMVDGVLGGNVLDQFKMTIDRPNSRLVLEPLRSAVSCSACR